MWPKSSAQGQTDKRMYKQKCMHDWTSYPPTIMLGEDKKGISDLISFLSLY